MISTLLYVYYNFCTPGGVSDFTYANTSPLKRKLTTNLFLKEKTFPPFSMLNIHGPVSQLHWIFNFLDPRCYCPLLRSNIILSNGAVGITSTTLTVEANIFRKLRIWKVWLMML